MIESFKKSLCLILAGAILSMQVVFPVGGWANDCFSCFDFSNYSSFSHLFAFDIYSFADEIASSDDDVAVASSDDDVAVASSDDDVAVASSDDDVAVASSDDDLSTASLDVTDSVIYVICDVLIQLFEQAGFISSSRADELREYIEAVFLESSSSIEWILYDWANFYYFYYYEYVDTSGEISSGYPGFDSPDPFTVLNYMLTVISSNTAYSAYYLRYISDMLGGVYEEDVYKVSFTTTNTYHEDGLNTLSIYPTSITYDGDTTTIKIYYSFYDYDMSDSLYCYLYFYGSTSSSGTLLATKRLTLSGTSSGSVSYSIDGFVASGYLTSSGDSLNISSSRFFYASYSTSNNTVFNSYVYSILETLSSLSFPTASSIYSPIVAAIEDLDLSFSGVSASDIWATTGLYSTSATAGYYLKYIYSYSSTVASRLYYNSYSVAYWAYQIYSSLDDLELEDIDYSYLVYQNGTVAYWVYQIYSSLDDFEIPTASSIYSPIVAAIEDLDLSFSGVSASDIWATTGLYSTSATAGYYLKYIYSYSSTVASRLYYNSYSVAYWAYQIYSSLDDLELEDIDYSYLVYQNGTVAYWVYQIYSSLDDFEIPTASSIYSPIVAALEALDVFDYSYLEYDDYSVAYWLYKIYNALVYTVSDLAAASSLSTMATTDLDSGTYTNAQLIYYLLNTNSDLADSYENLYNLLEDLYSLFDTDNDDTLYETLSELAGDLLADSAFSALLTSIAEQTASSLLPVVIFNMTLAFIADLMSISPVAPTLDVYIPLGDGSAFQSTYDLCDLSDFLDIWKAFVLILYSLGLVQAFRSYTFKFSGGDD